MNTTIEANTNTNNEKTIHRGEIFYMSFPQGTGSEQQGGRPVVIISNEMCNSTSPIVTAIPITSKEKTMLPTHVKLDEDLPVYGTILCEQICTTSKSRLSNYVGEVSYNTMKKIEKALLIQLDITKLVATESVTCENTTSQSTQDYAKQINANENLLKDKIRSLEVELIKTQERERVFKSLYEEAIRK